MAYVSIPKDLTAVKTKFALGLTKRQVVCFGAAVITGLPVFFLFRMILPGNIAAMFMMLIMLPWFLFAMYEKNGQPLEQYLKYMITVKYKKPPVRKYKAFSFYAVMERQEKLYREVCDIVQNKRNQ